MYESKSISGHLYITTIVKHAIGVGDDGNWDQMVAFQNLTFLLAKIQRINSLWDC
jgi:hypothetical protein